METAAESPLEVLSRAATMVQENQQAQSEDSKQTSNNNTKQLPTTKWKRERRCRLPEYSRKSDPKIPEVFNEASGGDTPPTPPQMPSPPPYQSGVPPPPFEQAVTRLGGASEKGSNDTPLDMSVRQRGLPPSYSQTISSPGYWAGYRGNGGRGAVGARDELPSGISMCDPIIDEHFRRSLGEDYLTLFSNNNVAKEKEPPKVVFISPPASKTTTENVIELMDSTGLSVDDHFAKALGDTWLKLNKKESEIKSNSENGSHSVVST